MPKKKMNTGDFVRLIKVQDLRMIVALKKQGTILNAANIMGLSQPAVTKRLQDLEKDLKVSLFHRMSRGVEPTPYGDIIIKHAHIILNQLRSAEGEVSDLSAGLGGRLNIGVPVAASTHLLSDAIIKLLKKRKSVQITIIEDYNIRLIPSLKLGQLDLIVGRLPEKNQYDDIDTESFYNESLQIVVRKEHPLANKKNISTADLLNWRWHMPLRDSIMYSKIENFFRKNEEKMPEVSIYSPTHTGNVHFLQHQDLIAVFPKEAVANHVKQGKVKVLDINLSDETTETGIITRSSGFKSPATNMFIEIIRKIGNKRN